MLTRRFALDSGGKKVYINDHVLYENKVYYIEDIKYLKWSKEQYLTLIDSRNKNKILDFILSDKISAIRQRGQQ